jgi:hypothetical protein
MKMSSDYSQTLKLEKFHESSIQVFNTVYDVCIFLIVIVQGQPCPS